MGTSRSLVSRFATRPARRRDLIDLIRSRATVNRVRPLDSTYWTYGEFPCGAHNTIPGFMGNGQFLKTARDRAFQLWLLRRITTISLAGLRVRGCVGHDQPTQRPRGKGTSSAEGDAISAKLSSQSFADADHLLRLRHGNLIEPSTIFAFTKYDQGLVDPRTFSPEVEIVLIGCPRTLCRNPESSVYMIVRTPQVVLEMKGIAIAARAEQHCPSSASSACVSPPGRSRGSISFNPSVALDSRAVSNEGRTRPDGMNAVGLYLDSRGNLAVRSDLGTSSIVVVAPAPVMPPAPVTPVPEAP